jgi:hypothetical protein
LAKVADVVVVNISLEINSEMALFVLLAADGAINRMGTGAVSNKKRDLFIGVTSEPLFPRLMAHLNDEMLNFMGGYDVPDKRGALCKLSIGLQFADGSNNGFGFSYGAKSKGPPIEIARFVSEAVSVTQPWFEAQEKMTGQKEQLQGKDKPWWKLW